MQELDQVIHDLLDQLSDGLDHPEVWALLAEVCAADPKLAPAIQARLPRPGPMVTMDQRYAMLVLPRILMALSGQANEAKLDLEALMVQATQHRLVHGALFFVAGLSTPHLAPTLQGRICPIPFIEMDVLENSAHLCCASWLPTSVGNLHEGAWQDHWNSPAAQDIRASILDGSYRHCTKMTCPVIQGDALIPVESIVHKRELQLDGPFEYLGVKGQSIELDEQWLSPVRSQAPAIVNLAYDRSCNLACPSCRSEKFMADGSQRDTIDAMQERAIEPMLEQAQVAIVTGSGDPLASKTFRHLLNRLGPETNPHLHIKLMTNGLLLNSKEWNRLSHLHGQIVEIKVSIDGTSAASHERLRKGSDWTTMLANLSFIGEQLKAHPHIHFALAFIVQRDNYHEMGDAVTLARMVGAHSLQFARITNWGTFSTQQYQALAITSSEHPEHSKFLAALLDPRLSESIVQLGDLAEFVRPKAVLGAARGPNPNALFPVAGDRRVCFLKNAIRNPNIIVGDYTYYDDPDPPQDFELRNVLYHYPFVGDRLIIGKFCSLARGVRFIMNGANHALRSPSSYLFPFFGHGWEHIGHAEQAQATSRGDTVLGNDVWLGYEACVMPGVKIGNGAVVGTRAVVTRDVPPYAIVAGNPARIVGYRFEPEIIHKLESAAWWDWSPQKIAQDLPTLLTRMEHSPIPS
jgi:acetyltransferase-like isoleucine patch superfamily enzyme/sulfatase maturation enzyme AslB (radical SAM superfamily)